MLENIVLSSRIRLARNFEDVNFPLKISDYDASKITKYLYELLSNFEDFEFLKIKNLSDIESLKMLEEQLISKELLDNKDISSVLINREKKENLSVMICEEDHIRLQCVLNGLSLTDAFIKIEEIDEMILENFKIAFSKQFGFLTASPSNLGTGMRASVMLFLPATTITGRIETLTNQVEKLGMTVRGRYGENSNAEGYFYQISNEASLGITENEIITNVTDVTKKICEMEEEFTKELLKVKYDEIKDICMRAFGNLTNSHILSAGEAIKLLSQVKLGINCGFFKIKNPQILDELTVLSQPAHIMSISRRLMNPKERDIFRAEYLRKQLILEKEN